ncbi:MAG TPA: hypothetical protein VFX72_08965 [Usitatibacteraceae bacterium]|nr:hypothetical protein [Usitatibacteraceae bacterium]
MNMPGKPEPKASYRQIEGNEQSRAAIDEVIGEAQKLLSIFDFTLDQRGYGNPARIEKLRHFLLAGRAHRIRIALHEPELLERHEPRLINLLRQFPAAIAIHRTVGQARNATDPFIVADDHSVWHLLHHEQHRAVVALHSPQDASPLRDRFEEIWELTEPAVSSSTLGL